MNHPIETTESVMKNQLHDFWIQYRLRIAASAKVCIGGIAVALFVYLVHLTV